MKAWKADVQSKIKQGMDSIRAGRGIPAEQVKVQMAAFKKKWMEDRQSKWVAYQLFIPRTMSDPKSEEELAERFDAGESLESLGFEVSNPRVEWAELEPRATEYRDRKKAPSFSWIRQPRKIRLSEICC
jgi:hypothetical protein